MKTIKTIKTMKTARRTAPVAIGALLAFAGLNAATIAPAGACGGLVGKNGTIQLAKTTTMAAYHDGIERYVTAFEFSGEGEEVGSIIPLPDVPTDVTKGGDWTLQRLVREVAPPRLEAAKSADAVATAGAPVQVLIEKEIDALDIKVLKGGGKEVGEWATKNGFFLPPDAPEVLEFYGNRSPVFMTAKFSAKRAQQLNQVAGQGTPIMLTIPTKEPWVPLRILGLGLTDQRVEADVFLLTDDEPKLLAGGSGLNVAKSDAASKLLLDDLRSDKGMEWVPPKMWLSYLQLDAKAKDLNYDLAIAANKDALPSVERVGVEAPATRTIAPAPSARRLWPIGVGLATGLLAVAVLVLLRRRPTGAGTGSTGTGPMGPFAGGSPA